MSAKEAQTQSCPKLIWGAEAIGEVIGRNTKQVHYLLEQRRLPAQKVGRQWVANYDALIAIGNPDQAN
jgi:hypothetical protein